jgi:hypothetical protein
MSAEQQQINYGTEPNDGNGDPLRTAFIKTDDNFDAIWAAGPVGSNVIIVNNTVSVTSPNADLVLKPNGLGVIQANASILPNTANIRDLGSAGQRWRSAWVGVGGANITGNVEAAYFVGNGAFLTGISASSNYGNANVAAFLPTYTGNISAGAVLTSIIESTDSSLVTIRDGVEVKGSVLIDGAVTAQGNVTGSYFIGNGSQLTGLPEGYTNANVVVLLSGLGSNTISTTGNITAGYFVGNGSQLTGLPAGYTDSDVITLLGAFGSNNIITTGNITAENFFGNTQGSTGNITNLVSLNFDVENISARGNAGVNIGAGGFNNLVVLETSVLVQNVPLSVTGNISGGNISTTGTVSATGNVTANNISTGNVAATRVQNDGNLEIRSNAAGTARTWTFDAMGDLNLPLGRSITGSGNINIGNVNLGGLGDGSITSNGNIIVKSGAFPVTLDNTGNVTVAGNLTVSGTAGNVVTKYQDSWTVPTGNSTQSFAVDGNNTYQMWVEGNIPNGIIAWNALVTVTNNNVPVLGQQFAWNYEGGGNVLMFNTIPAQIIGTAGAISNVEPAVSNTNVFSFGINNASGNTITVEYGWVKLS